MREVDRPLSERVSVLDRLPTPADRVPDWLSRAFDRMPVDRVRVALDLGDTQVFVARDDEDRLFLAVGHSGGGGAGGGPRSVLTESGAVVMACGDGVRAFVGGIVPDEVTAVRVGRVAAHLGENAFLAEIGRDDSPVVVVTTPAGDREVAGPVPDA